MYVLADIVYYSGYRISNVLLSQGNLVLTGLCAMAKGNSDNEDQNGDTPSQGRRDFLKKMRYVAPIMLTFEVAEDAWAGGSAGGKKSKKNNKKRKKRKKKVSPTPGLKKQRKKKRRVVDD